MPLTLNHSKQILSPHSQTFDTMPAFQFPADPTTTPTVVNPATNTTYQWKATPGKWVAIVKVAESVTEDFEKVYEEIERIDNVIEEEIDNRTELINQAQGKNNAQDAAIAELDARVDSISQNIGVLEFKGVYTYTLERSEAACNAAYVACTAEAAGDLDAIAQCDALLAQCQSEVGDPLADGTFTSVGTITLADVTELVITNRDKDGEVIDWLNVVEVGDYLELAEPNTLDGGVTGGDTVLYEVVADTLRSDGQENIRVKFIKETGNGDGLFDLQLDYTIRVFKKDLGIDINEADARYVARPYKVMFSDNAPSTGGAEDGVLKSGELWFDTAALELFVWNNNSWVTAAKPPTQDIVFTAALMDIQTLQEQPKITSSNNSPSNPRQGDLWFNPTTLKFAFYSAGAWINPDQS